MTQFKTGLAALGVLLGSVSTASLAHADIAVGVAGPITGEYASFGEQLRRGAEQAVKDINAAGGVNGEKLTLEIGDDACDPKQAVAVANDLANKGVKFVDGHFCSGSSIPASSVYSENGILQITPASTNPKLTDDAAAQGISTLFRTCGRDDIQGVYAADYVKKNFGGAKIAVLDDKSAYGKGLADATRTELGKIGVKPALEESYAQGDKDFSALISKLKAAGITVVYIGGYHAEAGLITRQASEQGLKAKFISGDALNTNEFWSITGDTGEGFMFTFAPDPRLKPEAAKVVDAFKAAGYDPEGYTLYTYAAMQIWAAAANATKSTDTKVVSDYIHKNEFKTVIGDLKFDAKGDITRPDYVMYKWSKGTYAEIK